MQFALGLPSRPYRVAARIWGWAKKRTKEETGQVIQTTTSEVIQGPRPGKTSLQQRALTIACAIYAACTLVSMAAMSVGAAVLGAAILFDLFSRRTNHTLSRQRFWASATWRYLAFACLLAGACAISVGAAMIDPLKIGDRWIQATFKDLAKAWYLFWPLGIAYALMSIDNTGRRSVLKTYLAVFGVISFLGIIQHFTGWIRNQVIPSGALDRYHATIFFGHHLTAASILVFPFFVTLGLAWQTRRGSLWALAGLSFVTLILTYSRMLWLALPLGLFFAVVWVLPRRLALMTVGMGGVMAVAAALIPTFARHYTSIGYSLASRKTLWEQHLSFFEQRPFTGVGWNRTVEASGLWAIAGNMPANWFSGHAHNNLIEMLSGTGLVGASAWFLFACVLVHFAWINRESVVARGVVCAWLVFHINGVTQVNFWDSKVLHTLMWVSGWMLAWAHARAAGSNAVRSWVAA